MQNSTITTNTISNTESPLMARLDAEIQQLEIIRSNYETQGTTAQEQLEHLASLEDNLNSIGNSGNVGIVNDDYLSSFHMHTFRGLADAALIAGNNFGWLITRNHQRLQEIESSMNENLMEIDDSISQSQHLGIALNEQEHNVQRILDEECRRQEANDRRIRLSRYRIIGFFVFIGITRALSGQVRPIENLVINNVGQHIIQMLMPSQEVQGTIPTLINMVETRPELKDALWRLLETFKDVFI